MRKLFYILRSFLLSLTNHKNVHIAFPAMSNDKTRLEGWNRIGRLTYINGTIIGRGTYICNDCDLTNAKIGRFCSIAQDVKIISGRHPSSVFVSTHPAFYSKNNQAGFSFVSQNIFDDRRYTDDGHSITIGNDVWIGYGARIMEGVTIGDGAIVGSCAIVTKDIPPYAICVGIPAQVIKYRFNEKDISFLSSLKWWNWDFETVKEKSSLFNNIDELHS